MVHQTTKLKIFLVILFISILSGCYYDNSEELYPSNGCDVLNMSYSNDIIPILTNNGCLGCHNDVATLDLNGYDDIKKYVDNGILIGSIKHNTGFRPMPEGSVKMNQCLIDKIESWINNGAPNN